MRLRLGRTTADFGGRPTGAAYIFVKPPGGWDSVPSPINETAKLTALDAAAGDTFGGSVSISGDTAIVGASGNDDAGPSTGSAYIFEKPPGGWVDMTETAKLAASDAAQGDQFGRSVSISGDIAIAGLPFSNRGVINAGAAYVFKKPPGGWVNMIETAWLLASDGAANDQFGNSVSIDGDTAIIGAFADEGETGSAYIFWEPWPSDNNGWGQVGKLTASDGAIFDLFGTSVSISGDVAVIGGPRNDDGGSSSGSAYIFDPACPCPWDLDGDGNVGILDLLALLAAWGTNPGGPPDFDGNGDVDVLDLQALEDNWGKCPCVEGPPPRSLKKEVQDSGLTWPGDWNLFVECLTNGTPEEQDNCRCWFDRYINGCPADCSQLPACGAVDPFNECPGDFTGPLGVPDCRVDAFDQARLLACWGMPCGDLTGDCTTDPFDQARLLANWGACPQAPLCGPGPALSCSQGAQGGGGSGSSSSLTEALAQMGFASVDEHQAWLIAASDSEAFVCACVLLALLEAQP
ncbi:MAG: FG-GAP repeat protein [Planctomycetota bacterium]|nr:FG-GAP repeat protein [Planctomycetota bacterium]MCZ6810455.1 FG-GAP repeat protein [Planctomycetota bacterium]